MSRADISGNSHIVPCPATLPTSPYRSNWEKKPFRRVASFGHWETSLSRAPLPPATGWSRNLTAWLSYVPQLGDVNNPRLIFNLHLAEDNGATGYAASGLHIPTTTVFLWRSTFLGFPRLTMLLEEASLLRTPDWYCHAPPRYLFLNMKLSLC